MFSDYFLNVIKDKKELSYLNNSYNSAHPFPHIVLNGVFDESFLYELSSQFPKPDDTWWKYSNELEKKFAKDDLSQMPYVHRRAIEALQSPRFLDFLEALTGISGLINDMDLRGGGLHQIARGGKLDVHVDFNIHPKTGLQRRVNVLLYLNPEWLPHWRGSLELWNKDMTECMRTIPPTLGTMAIFTISDDANHGHPDPLDCPDHITRKSIALYYYTRPTPDCNPPHSTIYKARPQDSKAPEMEELRQQRAKGRLING